MQRGTRYRRYNEEPQELPAWYIRSSKFKYPDAPPVQQGRKFDFDALFVEWSAKYFDPYCSQYCTKEGYIEPNPFHFRDFLEYAETESNIIDTENLSDSDIVYLGGLGRDVLFIEFLARIGQKAAAWAIERNLGIPRFDLAKDVIEPPKVACIHPEDYQFAVVALRMMNCAASHDTDTDRHTVTCAAISECIKNWMVIHTFKKIE